MKEWLKRWENGETGWHRGETHSSLVRHWSDAQVPNHGRVLVPLCGKTVDMRWLVQQGYRVLGVECSALAAAAFFAESNLEYRTANIGAYTVYSSEPIDIAVGDIFDLYTLPLTDIVGLYDRAALIALPSDLRIRYAETLCNCLSGGVRGLMITLSYPQSLRAGPPFSVTPVEVEQQFGRRFVATPIANNDILSENPGFIQAGIPELFEHVFKLTDRGAF